MEYVYAAMLLHKAGHKVEEASVKKVLEAAGIKTEEGKLRQLIAALEGVNIDEAVKNAAFVAAPAAVAVEHKAEAKKDDKKEEKAAEEASAAGLSALFG